MALQVFQKNIFKGVFMSRFKSHFGGAAGQKTFAPAKHAKAPEVAWLQAGKVPFRMRRDEIVAADKAEFEKFAGQLDTNSVLA